MTHALFIDVTRTDRLVGPTSLSFVVEKVYPVQHGLAERHWHHNEPFYSAADREKCCAIQARGGQGLALVVFRIIRPDGTCMFWFQCHKIEERVPAAHDMDLEQVSKLVKSATTCELQEQIARQFFARGSAKSSALEETSA
ncbi:uncharacterized protein PHACADRAFT_213168 [Phanerochaete carnosa HHB-10118-sp]|uniref:Uncharacterized protein n=1 Tax=Phanerochaete carnosa (strain HHB-10118-sp) TaxID=650164 RepID=K5VXL4_PHACS|nr:uncharacterized protein PHACADRAFT_213168 [Phanerochaete carnosa HHB-10118-sp]EKM51319.1 hypothetical protein PHACADRAFT_213168 [Phanerochaete carnosa HHB-10118-sp]